MANECELVLELKQEIVELRETIEIMNDKKIMKRFETKPSWNLANVGAETFKQVTDIKTFIQKVKEDVDKCGSWDKINPNFISKDNILKILDKNAGDL